MKNYKLKNIIILSLISALFIFIGVTQYNSFKKNITEANDQLLAGYKQQLQTIIYTYKINSDTFFNEKINCDDVLEIMYKVQSASIEEQEVLREQLHEIMIESYNEQIVAGYRQLHFHLIDNTSFLRMHRPSKYGDDLTEVRETVRLVNANLEYVEGFEEGKIFNGYRYVFPLIYNDIHVGSVEFSISYQSVALLFRELFDETSTFIIKREIVEDSVFESELSNYILSDLSFDYYYDKEVYDYYESSVLEEEREIIDSVNNKILENYKENIKNEEDFYIIDIENNRLVFFLSIRNIKDEHVAYEVFYNSNFSSVYNVNDIGEKLVYTVILWLLSMAYVVQLYKSRNKFINLTKTDKLTNCYNRHAVDEIFTREVELFRRYKKEFSMIMFDIDHFKKVNDEFGHFSGDIVLKGITQVVKDNIRTNDCLIRWGGEEFIILLPQSNLEDATICSEKIRKEIESNRFIEGYEKIITISLGVTVFNKFDTFDEVIIRLDRNLYKAKENGRNNVVSTV